MTIGKSGLEQTRVHDLTTAAALLDVFQSYGHSEIDTASFYGEGSSETMLGQLNWQSRRLLMATKYYPTAGRAVPATWDDTLRHPPTTLRKSLTASIKLSGPESWKCGTSTRLIVLRPLRRHSKLSIPCTKKVCSTDSGYPTTRLGKWGTGDPQSQRHIRTQDCPTIGRVNDEHKLQYLRCICRSVYPEGTESSTCQCKPQPTIISCH
jgi:hypothetical protein